jgi:hypothetical protein
MPKQPLYTKLESLEAAIIKEKKIQETGHTVLVESGKADRGGGGGTGGSLGNKNSHPTECVRCHCIGR